VITGGRLFAVSVPDWGQDHLSVEAVAAYVDDELAEGPRDRATRHLSACPDCAAQVFDQGQARAALRSAACPSMPSTLLSSLQSIPRDAELPPPPPGLAVTADGQLVSMLGALPHDAPPAGLAETPRSRTSGPTNRDAADGPSGHSRARIGAGIALTGLALIALGAAALPSGSGPSGGTPVVTAHLQLPHSHR
jgi:anti-sigma factor RsiW